MELEQEALAETGNILLNGCLGTIANNLQRSLRISLPEVVHGAEGAELFHPSPPPRCGRQRPVYLYQSSAVRRRNIQGYIAYAPGRICPRWRRSRTCSLHSSSATPARRSLRLMSPEQNDSDKAVLDAINGGVIVLSASERVVVWNAWMASGLSGIQRLVFLANDSRTCFRKLI